MFFLCFFYSNAIIVVFFCLQKSGNAVLGLPYALASLSFCQSFNLDLLKASATLTLAELWLSLGSNHAERASILIQGALPMILGHGGLELRSRAYIAEAKCYLSNPSFSGYRSLARSHPEVYMSHAGVAIWGLSVLRVGGPWNGFCHCVSETPLNLAGFGVSFAILQTTEELEILEYHELAAEAFYLMAMVFDKLGQLEEREEAAASFMKHIKALENPQHEQDPLFNIH
ncbi:Anaphase-promoting complex subunit 5 [Vitis vinifera]|uniref:Anaphase-promoting complex subunit 5 n=1 Tax=Vitis vinifera TaxID=29760 RepID=A0A438IPD4_VITVI|nr:Anaphase-promoting complex subunit 5 [Vitis vinifera]